LLAPSAATVTLVSMPTLPFFLAVLVIDVIIDDRNLECVVVRIAGDRVILAVGPDFVGRLAGWTLVLAMG
jgi:hypothetical protein